MYLMLQQAGAARPPQAFDSDYLAILAQATSLGYALPTAAQQEYENWLMLMLKASGAWTLMDVAYLRATANQDLATLNWKAPTLFQGVRTNSPTFTAFEGFTGNGTTSYVTYGGWDTQTNGVQYTLNACSIGAYSRTGNTGLASVQALVGGPSQQHVSYNSASGTSSRLNTASAHTQPAANISGLVVANRTASNSVNICNNGVVLGTTATTATAVSTTDFTTHSRGGASQFFSGQISFDFAGGDMTSVVHPLYHAINTYMGAIGKAV